MRGWDDLLAGREQRPRLEEEADERTPDQLIQLLDEIAADLYQSATGHPPDEIVTGSRGGISSLLPLKRCVGS